MVDVKAIRERLEAAKADWDCPYRGRTEATCYWNIEDVVDDLLAEVTRLQARVAELEAAAGKEGE